MTAQTTLLESAAGIMTRDMKRKWFQALLRQDMAFYDIKEVSGTAAVITSNGYKFRKYVAPSVIILAFFNSRLTQSWFAEEPAGKWPKWYSSLLP
jgi:hypothetical protein